MKKLEKYKKWADAEGSVNGRFVTHAVTAHIEGSLLYKRIALILAYTVVDIVYLLLFLVVVNFPAMVALVPVLTWIMVYFTWCFVQQEYEYRIDGGVLMARKVYGGRYTVALCTVGLSELAEPIPHSEADELLKTIPSERQIRCYSALKSKIHVARFLQDGKEFLLLLELNGSSTQAFRYSYSL